jgi:hypothetical protein
MPRWRVRLIALLATIVASVALFSVLVHLMRPGWRSNEYLAITVWTAPLALLAAAIAPALRRRLAGRRVAVRLAVTAILAVMIAIAWTFAAVALTGGYALAFDANPLWCWGFGGLAGLLTATLIPEPPRRGRSS